MKIYLLQQAPQSSFWFWFVTELFFVIFVALLLYFFIVKNPKINNQFKRKNPNEKD